MPVSRSLTRGLLAFTLAFAFTFPVFAAEEPVDYDRHIAPLMRQYCAGCHNEQDFEGDFSVEYFASLREGGSKGDPLEPGKPDESYFLRTILGEAKPKMPPEDEPQLSTSEVDLFRRWIAEGAQGPKQDEGLFAELAVPAIPTRGNQPFPLTAAATSPDGKHLALARFGQVEIVDARSRKVLRRLPDLPGKVNALNYTPDGKQLLAATGITGLSGQAVLWNATTGEELRRFEGHRDSLYDAEFSPDGKLVATAGYDTVIRLWNCADGKLIRSIDIHNGAIFDLAFSPDGSILASASADETVKLWRVSDGLRLDTLNQPLGEQNSVVFTPDGKHILAGGADNRIRLWKLISQDEPRINPLLTARFAHEGALVRLALSEDGTRLVSAAEDGGLKLWSVPELIELHAFETQPDLITSIDPEKGFDSFSVSRMDGSLRHYRVPRKLPANAGAQNLGGSAPAPPVDLISKETPAPLQFEEVEPNNLPTHATRVKSLPAQVSGHIQVAGDRDLYRFSAREGETWMFEINGARSKSPLDSRLEILDTEGRPVERVVLQAQRDSWFTFRGKDSNTSGDFRLHNWREMELNDYLFANGEVVRLWLYPRGPDSGFKVYPGFGNRHSYFGTTPVTHSLGEPCYIVKPFPAGSDPAPNGLPVFRLHYENDDDPSRRFGKDSVLAFTAPRDGDYLVRVGDTRNFGGEAFRYTLDIRPSRPDYTLRVSDSDPKTKGQQGPKVSPGSGKEFTLTLTRLDGFEGPVSVEVRDLPTGFSVAGPVEIEAGQYQASGVILAAADAPAPQEGAPVPRLVGTARIAGREIVRDLGPLGPVSLGAEPKVTLTIERAPGKAAEEKKNQTLELFIRPGETISAVVRADRKDFKDRIEFGTDDSGRNFAHGLFIDNIGLNGLMIVPEQTQREFFITAAPWVRPSTRLVHLRTKNANGEACAPIKLTVLPPYGARVAER